VEYRIEKDSMGEIKVPKQKLWGAQTQRSLQNFMQNAELMPNELIQALALVKKACALANGKIGAISKKKAQVISSVCDEIKDGRLEGNFPLTVWQTGSGTQTNMNLNEVIANRGNEIAGLKLLHPNDDVNASQSSNDVFPTAMHVAAVLAINSSLIPVLIELIQTFNTLAKENEGVLKIGRTHLQDATPITFAQEISAWQVGLMQTHNMIIAAMPPLYQLALGGTAVGTGLNAPAGFASEAADILKELTGHSFVSAANKFSALSMKDALVFSHGALKALSANLLKIANDVRWLASGPRCGLGEITIPENEPGSSIMPGKVNPTQCEALSMVCIQVMGNDMCVGMAASQGNFQLNVFMPLIINNFLQSVRLLSGAISMFNKNCASGIKALPAKMQHNLNNSLMLVTALSPHIGYDKAAQTAKLAHKENITLLEAVTKLGFMSESEFKAIFKPEEMV
jgi:fumarate hydratase class II